MVVKHIGLWDTELTWYFSSATRRICLYGLEYVHGIYACRPNWPCLIVEFLAARTKFLEPSWSTAPSHFAQQMSLVASTALLDYITHSSAQLSNHMEGTNAQHSAPNITILPTTGVPSTVSVMWYPCRKLARTKILQNFWLTRYRIFREFFSDYTVWPIISTRNSYKGTTYYYL